MEAQPVGQCYMDGVYGTWEVPGWETWHGMDLSCTQNIVCAGMAVLCMLAKAWMWKL